MTKHTFASDSHRSTLLRANASFLLVASVAGLVADVLGTFFSWGPTAGLQGALPACGIGFIEAHGLALIVGVLLWRAARTPAPLWHATAAAVHTLLGGANILFWDKVFVAYGMLGVGWVTTTCHIGFMALELAAFALSPATSADT